MRAGTLQQPGMLRLGAFRLMIHPARGPVEPAGRLKTVCAGMVTGKIREGRKKEDGGSLDGEYIWWL